MSRVLSVAALLLTAASTGAFLGCYGDTPGGSSTVEEKDQMCAVLAGEACDQRAGCMPVLGERPDTARNCLVPSARAGCLAQVHLCDAQQTLALTPDGACWRFKTTCLPVGWRAAERDECTALAGLPACPEQP
jgi:hypothetical protein